MEEGNTKVQYLVSFAVSLAASMIGMTLAWGTPVIPKFHNNETSIYITDSQISWMVALSSPGFMTGSLVTRFISDRFGRRITILGSAIPNVIGTVILVVASQAWMLYVSKFLLGCGSGMLGTVSSVYLAEIANKEIRGFVTMLNRFMQVFGIFLVMAVGPFVSFQVLNYMLLVFPIMYFMACWWIPETPYYLLKKGRIDAARKVLLKLNGYKDEKVLEDKLSSMRADVIKEMQRSSSFKELFTGRQYRKAIVIVVGLKLTQIMTGSLVVQQYLGPIIQESHSNINVATAIIIFGAVRVIVGVIASTLVDKVGRRPLLIYSYFGSSVSLAIVGTYFFFQEVINLNQEILTAFGFVPFLGIICSYVISTLGFNMIVYVIPAEIFPLNVKSIAMTCANILAASSNFVVVKCYQQVKDALGLCGAFWIFTSASIIGTVFTYFFVPETKNKSLKEIQMELQGDLYDYTNEDLKQVVTKLVEDKDTIDATELKEMERKES